jgi:hypothetical protein
MGGQCGYQYMLGRPGGGGGDAAPQTVTFAGLTQPSGRGICAVVVFIILLVLAFIIIANCFKKDSPLRGGGVTQQQQGQPFYAQGPNGELFLVYGDKAPKAHERGNKPTDAAPSHMENADLAQAAKLLGYGPGQQVAAADEEPVPRPQVNKPPSDMKCSLTQGPRPQGPDVPIPIDGSVYQPLSDWEGNTQTAGKIPAALVAMESNAGSPYQNASFKPSAATKEFYDAFNPQALSSMMPAAWRGGGDAKNCVQQSSYNGASTENAFDEFSRYSVSPMSAQRAEALRGTMRLSELSSTRNARTLGTTSLLREMVSPLSPIPVGSTNFAWGDSSERLAMIAAATGSYPDSVGC